jgi:hypothetical protein
MGTVMVTVKAGRDEEDNRLCRRKSEIRERRE